MGNTINLLIFSSALVLAYIVVKIPVDHPSSDVREIQSNERTYMNIRMNSANKDQRLSTILAASFPLSFRIRAKMQMIH